MATSHTGNFPDILSVHGPDSVRLAWRAPASDWFSAIPIGNGRQGAMVFGGNPARYQVNDATVWSGHPGIPAEELDRVVHNGAGPALLRTVREALDAGDVRGAEELLMRFEGRYSQEFLPFVDLEIDIPGAVPAPGVPARILDLDAAVVEEQLVVNGIAVRRRSWASAPARAVFVEILSEQPLPVVGVRLSSPLPTRGEWAQDDAIGIDVDVPIDGAPLHEAARPAHLHAETPMPGWDGMAAAAVSVSSDGIVSAAASGLRVASARRVLLALSSSSRAASWWAGQDGEHALSAAGIRAEARDLARAAVRSADPLADHLADLSALAPARFALGGRRGGVWDVQDDLLHGDDHALRSTLMAEFGRYLITASSRRGGPAANLQGIWNQELRPAWSSNYTININTEMNYWAAPLVGLTDPAEPLIALVERMASTGADVAARLYGARGWVGHHNSDLWGWSLPVGDGHGAASWAQWALGGVWLCHNLWDQYSISRDPALLRRIWPLLRGAALFCLDWLQPAGDGALRTSPSTSPENSFVGDDGAPTALGDTATMDLALIGTLFERCLLAIAALGSSDAESGLVQELRDAVAALPSETVAPDGRLREWTRDHVEHEPAHRHLSPLVGVHPLDRISPDATPELAEAAIRFLDARGSGAMGWSWAWKTAMRARLGQAEIAADLLEEAFTAYEKDNARHAPVDGSEWGGLLPNLFSTHPPFQIDGNYGFTAAIVEMVLQSHRGELHAAPAIPASWPRGAVTGLHAHGGWGVDVEWDEGAVRVVVRERTGVARDVVVRVGTERRTLALPADGAATLTFVRGASSGR